MLIEQAIEWGVFLFGDALASVKNRGKGFPTVIGVPFALAGSIRDDGPMPDTMMDLLKAQAEYARLLEKAQVVLMLGSMLH